MTEILHFPAQPHFFSFGGFDIQMNRVIENLNKYEIKSTKVDLWNINQKFDIAHFWGTSNSHFSNIELCKQNNIPTIISALFPPDYFLENFKTKTKIKISNLFRLKRSLRIVDYIFVINIQQAEIANQIFNIDRRRIYILNTILDDIFYTNHSIEVNSFTFKNYGICVGTICKRKNQLSILNAAIKSNQNMLFIGRPDTSESIYFNEFKKTIENHPSLFKYLNDVSPDELKFYYENSNFVTCLSDVETEPATILEAMVCNKPLIVSSRPFTNFDLYQNTLKVDPYNISKIISCFKNISVINYSKFIAEDYYSSNVLQKYVDTYSEILI